jgi:hypothetical protein
MANRFAYERAVLANRGAAQALGFSELASLPAYVAGEAQQHTVYDGTIVNLDFQTGVLCDGSLVVEILGPFWDRIFRLEFRGVTSLDVPNYQILLGADLREVRFDAAPVGAAQCQFVNLTYGFTMTVVYRDIEVTWSMLTEPLDRREDAF